VVADKRRGTGGAGLPLRQAGAFPDF